LTLWLSNGGFREVAKALYEAGFYSLHAPRVLGGPEEDLRTAFEVYRQLGRGCGSSAWTAMILSGGSLVASLFGARAREELWGADPRAGVCSRFAPEGEGRPVDGGMIVSGSWRPMSGVHQSTWAVVAFRTAGEPADGHEPVMLALVPVDEGSVERTWGMTGLRATGSDTLTYDGVFVPRHRLMSLRRMLEGGYGAEHPDEHLYGATVITALIATVIGPLLGLAETALECVLSQLGTSTREGQDPPTTPRRSEKARVQAGVAEAASCIDTARMRIERALSDVERGISSASQLDPFSQARARVDAAVAAENLRESVRLLLTATGSRSFATAEPLQRVWRDIEIALAHPTIVPEDSREAYGRALLNVGDAAGWVHIGD